MQHMAQHQYLSHIQLYTMVLHNTNHANVELDQVTFVGKKIRADIK